MNTTRLVLVLAAVSGCTAPVQPELSGPFTVTPAEPWAGGAVTVTGPSFRDGGDGAVLRLGTVSVSLERVDDTSMTAVLPPTLGGSFQPQLEVAGQVVELDPITIAGYAETFEVQPQLLWDVLVWPRDGRANVMGVSLEGLTLIQLDTRSVTTFDSLLDWNLLRGPGVTYQDNVFLLRPRNSAALESWTLLPTPRRLAVHADIFSNRQVMRLGPNAWFVSSAHQFSTYTRADSAQPYQETDTRAEETEGVHMSPRGDRATIQVDRAWSGLPVYAVPSGDVAYVVTQMQVVEGVAFSRDGALLALVGGIDGILRAPSRVLLLDAGSGDVLADTTIAEAVFAVAIDPTRPLLYVGLSVMDTTTRVAHPAVLVLHQNSLQPVGRLEVPSTETDCTWGCYKGVIALSDLGDLYVAWSFNSIGTTVVHRFTLPAGNANLH